MHEGTGVNPGATGRVATISGVSSWPDSITSGSIVNLNNSSYVVQERISNTQIRLADDNNVYGDFTDDNYVVFSTKGIYFYPRVISVNITNSEYNTTSTYQVELEVDEIFNVSALNLSEEDFNSAHITVRAEKGQSFSDMFSDTKFDTVEGQPISGIPNKQTNFKNLSGKVYLSDVSENWSIEPQEQYHGPGDKGSPGDEVPIYNITHTMSAVGKRAYDSGGLIREPWQNAKIWVEQRLGLIPVGDRYSNSATTYPRHRANVNDESHHHLPQAFTPPDQLFDDDYVNSPTDVGGIFDSRGDYSDLGVYNYKRNLQVDKFSGSYSITETFILCKPGAAVLDGNSVTKYGDAIVNFSLDATSSEAEGTPVHSVSITINGLEKRGVTYYDSEEGMLHYTGAGNEHGRSMSRDMDNVLSSKYENARRVYQQEYMTEDHLKTAIRSYSTSDIAKYMNNLSTSFNEQDGVITVSAQFSNELRRFHEFGFIEESMSVTTTLKAPQVAQIPVPGRAAGPVVQDLSTVSAGTITCNVQLQGPPGTAASSACVAEVEKYMKQAFRSLSGTYWKTTDQTTSDPWRGSYNRQITYTYV